MCKYIVIFLHQSAIRDVLEGYFSLLNLNFPSLGFGLRFVSSPSRIDFSWSFYQTNGTELEWTEVKMKRPFLSDIFQHLVGKPDWNHGSGRVSVDFKKKKLF